MNRRDLIALLGSTAAAWPLGVRAQQGERTRRIGVLMNFAPDDPNAQARMTAFLQRLQELGWTDGRNVRIDIRWGAGDVERIHKSVAELLALAPDVVLTTGGPTTGPVLRATHTVPIVFVQITDPVGSGFVEGLARPGGNATGFSNFEYGTSAKWLELLKQIAPKLTRMAVLRDPTVPSGAGQFGALQTAAPSFGVEFSPINLNHPEDIERSVTSFAHEPDSGLVVPAGGAAVTHRDLIIRLATLHKLPAVYSDHVFVSDGGLMSYGPDRLDQYGRAAGYVDRILRGQKPADLPVQAPTKYELVINLKTAKALGLDVPPTLLARADEVIE
jgi:putative ABC transport system substrate-binding protein